MTPATIDITVPKLENTLIFDASILDKMQFVSSDVTKDDNTPKYIIAITNLKLNIGVIKVCRVPLIKCLDIAMVLKHIKLIIIIIKLSSVLVKSLVKIFAITLYPEKDNADKIRRIIPFILLNSEEEVFINVIQITPNTDIIMDIFCNRFVFSFRKNLAKIKVNTGEEANNIPASEEEAYCNPKV